MKKSLAILAAGALLATSFAALPASAETGFKVKKDTSAATVGKCATATMLFAKLGQDETKPKTDADKTMEEMSMLWITFMANQDAAFVKVAGDQMTTTLDGYKKSIDTDQAKALSEIMTDSVDCLAFLE